MLPGPVFTFELLILARRTRYYVFRAAYGFLLLFLIWLSNPTLMRGLTPDARGEISIAEMARLGNLLFTTFAVTQSLVILLITPALVAGVIADERKRKTLHYLLASRLTSGEIILGKLGARTLHVGVLVALGLPIVVILSLFGGVDPNAVVLFFAASATTLFLLASASIAVSTISSRPRDAILAIYMLELLWLFGPSLIESLGGGMSGPWLAAFEFIQPALVWLGASSPFYVAMEITNLFGKGNNLHENVILMMGLQVAAGTVLVSLAVARLRPGFRAEGARSRWMARLFGRRTGRLFPRPACGADPMWWKERHAARASRFTKLVGAVLFLVVMGPLLWGTVHFSGPAFTELRQNGYFSEDQNGDRSDLNSWLRFVVPLLGSFAMLGTACAAAGGLTGEREEDTWISLISTPLTAEEIIRAKMFGAVWGMRLILACWLGFLGLGLVLDAVHPIALVLEIVTTAVFIAFGCALGTFYSLHSRNSTRALTATIGTLLFSNVLYLMCLVLIPFGHWFALVGMTPVIEGLILFKGDGLSRTSGFEVRAAIEISFTCLVSVVVHGFGVCVLTGMTIGSFDAINDRPPRIGSRPRRPPPGTLLDGDGRALAELVVLDETGPARPDEQPAG